jgi:hypothetical protein
MFTSIQKDVLTLYKYFYQSTHLSNQITIKYKDVIGKPYIQYNFIFCGIQVGVAPKAISLLFGHHMTR